MNLRGNENILNFFESVNLKVKELDLYGNTISYINILETVIFNKLEKLDLNINEICDINILEKVIFK